jgi:hypothetical protein
MHKNENFGKLGFCDANSDNSVGDWLYLDGFFILAKGFGVVMLRTFATKCYYVCWCGSFVGWVSGV